jgi:hypothetical protein
MMQNGGNYANVKGVPLQPLSLWGENVGKILPGVESGCIIFLATNNKQLLYDSLCSYNQRPQENGFIATAVPICTGYPWRKILPATIKFLRQ